MLCHRGNSRLWPYDCDEIPRLARNDNFLEEDAMRWRRYNCKRERRWISDQVGDDSMGEAGS